MTELEIVRKLLSTTPKLKFIGSPGPDLRNPDGQEAAAIITELAEALEKIAGGHFPDASTMAVEGRWQDFANALQKAASAALSRAKGQQRNGK